MRGGCGMRGGCSVRGGCDVSMRVVAMWDEVSCQLTPITTKSTTCSSKGSKWLR